MAHKIQIPVKPEVEKKEPEQAVAGNENLDSTLADDLIPDIDDDIIPEIDDDTNSQLPAASNNLAEKNIAEFEHYYQEFTLVQQSILKDIKKSKFSQLTDVVKTGEKALAEGDELMEYLGMGHDDAIISARDKIIDIEKKKNEIVEFVGGLDDKGRLDLFPQNSAYGDFTMADVHSALALAGEADWLPETQRVNLLNALEEKRADIDKSYNKAKNRNFIWAFLAAFISLVIFLIIDILLFDNWTWTGYVAIVIYLIKIWGTYSSLNATAKFYGKKHRYKFSMRALSFF